MKYSNDDEVFCKLKWVADKKVTTAQCNKQVYLLLIPM
jgi:hypothetical protein